MMLSFRRRQRGFTLIELMVTLVVAGILMLVAVPSFLTYKRNSELTSATNTLFAAINAARGEAMKRGTNAAIVPSADGTGSAWNGTDWNKGWIVFVDVNLNGVYDAGDIPISQQLILPSYVTVSANGTAGLASAPYIMFNASGFSKDKANAPAALSIQLVRNDVSSSNSANETRRIKIAMTGRTRSCKPTSSTDTTCSANND